MGRPTFALRNRGDKVANVKSAPLESMILWV